MVVTKRIYTDSVRNLHRKIPRDPNEFSFDVHIFPFETILLLKVKWKRKTKMHVYLLPQSTCYFEIYQWITNLAKTYPARFPDILFERNEIRQNLCRDGSRKSSKYCETKRVAENYIVRIKEPTEYSRTARVDLCESIFMLVEKLRVLIDKT